ncbi:MAG: Fic family protein [Candidatus Gracilibacteria bacterium]|nr:Fic family protein [Candidatus Gracilibacteria bacterium]
MKKHEKISKIISYFDGKNVITASEIADLFSIERTTAYRYIKELIESNLVVEISKGKYSIKMNPSEYLKMDFFDRKKASYNFLFLEEYIPNITSFLGKRYEDIKELYQDKDTLSTYDYLINMRGIENLLIDISYTSSRLEGNTYSYLDTEVLIKYNEEAEGKTKSETQMILNHKNAIKYIVDNRKNISYSKSDFFNLHKILGKGLLSDEFLGNIRNKEVKIGGSTYLPLDNRFQLEGEFEKFLSKLNQIRNPFEQSIFILVFIPYFQLFMDINKRTSRLGSNIPLIKNGLAPLSLLQINERDYINAMLSIYELNDVSLLSEIFTDNYIKNFDRYN